MRFGTLDFIYLVPLVIFTIIGYRKGFIVEILTIIALVFAIIGSMKLTQTVIGKIGINEDMVWWIPYLAYLAVFVIIFFVIMWIGKILEKIIKIAQLSFVNNILGALMGAFKITFFFSLFLWLTDQTVLMPENMAEHSITYKYVVQLAPKIINFVTDNTHLLTNLIQDIEGWFDKMIPDYY